ncbi:MAG: phenylacetate-CoA oxygenase subunit PaaC [Burkholderiales bacterium]|nr:phenylacetate-CoA oxygenase subunit PaaC [Burkholderiales bacterium]
MTKTATAPLELLLHLADCALVLGQRNAEWCGHGPVLEEDIALANLSLDLIGQARLLYQHAAAQINDQPGLAAALGLPAAVSAPVTEDSLAYFRDAGAFRNYTLLELPHTGPLAPGASHARDYAVTTVRNFLYSALMALRWEALAGDADTQLAAIAARSLKEARYHLRHARDWLVRLGDGTAVSHARTQAALDHLMPYTAEFWHDPATAALRAAWDAQVDDALAEATLSRPDARAAATHGSRGRHSEHLDYLLAEMQVLARQHPGATW